MNHPGWNHRRQENFTARRCTVPLSTSAVSQGLSSTGIGHRTKEVAGHEHLHHGHSGGSMRGKCKAQPS